MNRSDYIYLFCGIWWTAVLLIDQFYLPIEFVKLSLYMGVPGIALGAKKLVLKEDLT